MDALIARALATRAELDRLKGAGAVIDTLEAARDLELTFTSNAIEGNTLSAGETALVIEKGLTVAGKPLKDHLEAVDHHEALGYVRDLSRASDPFTEMDVRNIHRLVVARSCPDIAGRYADRSRFVPTDTGRYAFPAPSMIPALMGEFARWLRDLEPTPEAAFDAHRRLVDIHPFNDGNGRTARLLMNLVLLRGGWPPVPIGPAARADYLASLQIAQAGGGRNAFRRLLWTALLAELDASIEAARQSLDVTVRPTPS